MVESRQAGRWDERQTSQQLAGGYFWSHKAHFAINSFDLKSLYLELHLRPGIVDMAATMPLMSCSSLSGQRLVTKSVGATRINAPRNMQIQCRSLEAGELVNSL